MTSAARTQGDARPEAADAPPVRVGMPRFVRVAQVVAAATRRPSVRDLGVVLAFVAVAVWLTAGLWADPTHRVLALNDDDQTLLEWFLAHHARLMSGEFTVITGRLNAPDGVNLMANASIIGVGVLLAPLTALFGAPVSYVVALTAGLAGTAAGWYLLFARTLRAHRVAAAIGGAFCGFAPAMISQSISHLHMSSQWLVPVIVYCVIRLARASDPTTGGGWHRLILPSVGLAAAVTAQVFVGEEVLFLAALSLALFTIGYTVAAPRRAARLAPRFLAGIAVATALAVAVLVYPLSIQFSGPQSVPNGPFNPAYFSADLASFPAISPLSVAGVPENARLTTGPSEYNTFLGWPLLLATLGCVIWLWRRPATWGIVLAGVVMAWLSLGPQIVIDGERTTHHGLYTLLEGLPVIDGALPMRFAVALVPLIAVLLVGAVDRALRPDRTAAAEDQFQPQGVRLIALAAVITALAPLAPLPLPTMDRRPVPEFISGGQWRDCVEPGGVLVPVPLPTPPEPEPMRWAAATGGAFGLPEGFFIGPYGADGRASMGTYSQPTSHLLKEVARTGNLPGIGINEMAQAQRDIDFWGASCVALAPYAPHHDQLLVALEALFGPGQMRADTWTWKVVPGPRPPR